MVRQIAPLSYLRHSASVTVDLGVTTLTSAIKHALSTPAISIFGSPAIADECSQLADTAYMDAGRPGSDELGFLCSGSQQPSLGCRR